MSWAAEPAAIVFVALGVGTLLLVGLLILARIVGVLRARPVMAAVGVLAAAGMLLLPLAFQRMLDQPAAMRLSIGAILTAAIAFVAITIAWRPLHLVQWVCVGTAWLILAISFVLIFHPAVRAYVEAYIPPRVLDGTFPLVVLLLFAPGVIDGLRREEATRIGRIGLWGVTLLGAGLFVAGILLGWGLLPPPAADRYGNAPSGLLWCGAILIIVGQWFSAFEPLRVARGAGWYGVGLLIVGVSSLLAFQLNIALTSLSVRAPPVVYGFTAIDLVWVALVATGAAMTLRGNLWHPAQWLAAGAGAAAVAGSVILSGGNWSMGDGPVALGLLTILVVPRLITYILREYPQQVADLGRRLLSEAEAHPWAPLFRKDAKAGLAPTGVLRVAVDLSSFPIVSGKDADGTPTGVAPDMAAEVARRLDVPVRYVPYDTPGALTDAVDTDAWDIALTGAALQRAQRITFTPAYAAVDAGCLVPGDSPIASIADVDKPGVRIAVAGGSDCGLWLDRNLEHATLVRTDTPGAACDRFLADRLDALAGLRPQLLADAGKLPGARVLDGSFTAVPQAIGTGRRKKVVATYLRAVVEEAKASGLVQGLIDKHRAGGLSVAPADDAAHPLSRLPERLARAWHPREWSAYGVAWLMMAAAIVAIGVVGDAAEGTVGRGIAYTAAVVFLAGMLTTLYGNLRHPLQWLAAGAGAAALVGSAFLPAGSDPGKLLAVAGIVVFLAGPKLIGSRLRARAPTMRREDLR